MLGEEGGRPLSAAVAVVIAQIEAAEERGGMLRFTSGGAERVSPSYESFRPPKVAPLAHFILSLSLCGLMHDTAANSANSSPPLKNARPRNRFEDGRHPRRPPLIRAIHPSPVPVDPPSDLRQFAQRQRGRAGPIPLRLRERAYMNLYPRYLIQNILHPTLGSY